MKNLIEFKNNVKVAQSVIEDCAAFLDDEKVAEYVYSIVGQEYKDLAPVFSVIALIENLNSGLV